MEQFHLLFCSVFSGIQGQEPIVWCILLQNSHFDPNFTLDPENLHKFPQPLVTAHGLGHLGSECSRNSSEPILNLYFNQRATCYCNSSFIISFNLVLAEILYLSLESTLECSCQLCKSIISIYFSYFLKDHEGSWEVASTSLSCHYSLF